ncbi:collagen alpha-1(I) chain-like isoform X1 [Dipodomys merriami]|uniref:collagen alpha-1(I) chain-like isoform X1 n=2 Tax=Dipodomys merriami TaxID=94247 RepID=UPI003855C154
MPRPGSGGRAEEARREAGRLGRDHSTPALQGWGEGDLRLQPTPQDTHALAGTGEPVLPLGMSWKGLGPGLFGRTDPGLLPQQPQSTSHGPNPHKGASEPRPPLCPLRAGEELAPWSVVGRAGGTGCSHGEEPPPEDQAAPDPGFLPYYRSPEEILCPSPGASRHPGSGTEAQAGRICGITVRDAGRAESRGWAGLSGAWRSPACSPCPPVHLAHARSHGQDALPATSQAPSPSGFTPYYRSPEERLSTSPGPPTPALGANGPPGERSPLRAATL